MARFALSKAREIVFNNKKTSSCSVLGVKKRSEMFDNLALLTSFLLFYYDSLRATIMRNLALFPPSGVYIIVLAIISIFFIHTKAKQQRNY